jgi:hypothetical protein
MPTLNWIGKQVVVNHHQQVRFHLLKDGPELSCGDPGSGNLIVQQQRFEHDEIVNLARLRLLLMRYSSRRTSSRCCLGQNTEERSNSSFLSDANTYLFTLVKQMRELKTVWGTKNRRRRRDSSGVQSRKEYETARLVLEEA